MIIQGSNSPIAIAFDTDVSNVTEWSVALYGEDKRGAPTILLKHWNTEDMVVEDSVAYAPLTETETMAFNPCVASLEIKWLDPDDNIFHSDIVRIRISGRNDKTQISQAQQTAEDDDEG